MLKGKKKKKKLKNIKVKRIIFYGKVIYLNLEGKIQFDKNNKQKIMRRIM